MGNEGFPALHPGNRDEVLVVVEAKAVIDLPGVVSNLIITAMDNSNGGLT